MCLVRSWCMGFSVSALAAWLSQKILVVPFCSFPSSFNNLRIQTICFAHSHTAMYSLSHDESVTHFCLLLTHATAVPFTFTMYPEWDLRVSGHPAWSASENPTNIAFSFSVGNTTYASSYLSDTAVPVLQLSSAPYPGSA